MSAVEQLPDLRFKAPLYSVTEAAGYLGVPRATLDTWAKGYVRQPKGKRPVKGAPVITSITSPGTKKGGAGEPTIPFVGFAEAMVLAAVRNSGVPLQRIRPALEALESQFGLSHALASKRLYTDGAEVLYDYAESTEDLGIVRNLVVVRNNQRVFTEVVLEYLQRIEYSGSDGYAALVHLPRYAFKEVVVDPTRSFGKPIFDRGGSRVSDVLDRFQAGESLDELVEEFGVPTEHLQDALRVASVRTP